MAPLSRLGAVVRLTGAQLRYYRAQLGLAVVGVTLAVLLMVLLTGLGYGLTTTGAEAMAWIEAELWIAGGPIALTPGGVGGVENPMQDAHAFARDVEDHEAVRDAQPLAFQTVYVSPDGEEFDTIVGVGGLGRGDQLDLRGADRFTPYDAHYANGSYDGPMTGELVIDRQTAERYDLGIGDTLHVGGTLAAARETEFEVIDITGTYSNFLGTPTVAMHLSELQEVTGTTGTDRAALVTARLAPGADPRRVRADLKRAHPGYEIRTKQEQVQAVIGNQAAVVASAVTLVVLALATGVILLVNVLALLVHQQRRELAGLKAVGVSTRLLVGVVLGQGVAIGLLGGVLALLVTPAAVQAVNAVAAEVSGFPNLIKTPLWVAAMGLGLGVLMGAVGATVAGWRVLRLRALTHLEP